MRLITAEIIAVFCLVFLIAGCEKKDDFGSSHYLQVPSVKNTHSFNESPCPQLLGEVKVSCSNDADADGCSADSVYFENNGHPSIWGVFDNNYGANLSDGEFATLYVHFNCRESEDISHTFEAQFFHNGEPVGTEELLVELTYIK